MAEPWVEQRTHGAITKTPHLGGGGAFDPVTGRVGILAPDGEHVEEVKFDELIRVRCHRGAGAILILIRCAATDSGGANDVGSV